MFKKITTTAALALVGLGVGAAGASAASISGGSYASVPAYGGFSIAGGAYTHGCSDVTFEGDATGAASSTFTPILDGCSFFGFPVFDQPSGPWTMTVGDDHGSGDFPVTIEIPAGTVTTLENPLWGYTISLPGPQTLPDAGVLRNVAGGAELELNFSGVTYVAVGGPFSSGNDFTYSSSGPMSLPGVTVS